MPEHKTGIFEEGSRHNFYWGGVLVGGIDIRYAELCPEAYRMWETDCLDPILRSWGQCLKQSDSGKGTKLDVDL